MVCVTCVSLKLARSVHALCAYFMYTLYIHSLIVFRWAPAKLATKHETKVAIHPKSVNSEEDEFDSRWLVYHLKMKTTKVFHCYKLGLFIIIGSLDYF